MQDHTHKPRPRLPGEPVTAILTAVILVMLILSPALALGGRMLVGA